MRQNNLFIKTIFLNVLALIALSVSLNAQTVESLKSGGNQRSAPPFVLTISQRTAVSSANGLGAKAVIVYNRTASSFTDQTGDNPRRTSISIVSKTKDGVAVYSDGTDNLAYDPARNAFIQVKTRQQALRVATKAFEPVNNAAGQKLRSRNASATGEKVEIIKGVTENRARVKTREADEEDLSNN